MLTSLNKPFIFFKVVLYTYIRYKSDPTFMVTDTKQWIFSENGSACVLLWQRITSNIVLLQKRDYVIDIITTSIITGDNISVAKTIHVKKGARKI